MNIHNVARECDKENVAMVAAILFKTMPLQLIALFASI